MKAFRPDEPRAGSGAPPQDVDPPDTTNGRRFEEPVTEEVESRMVFDKSRLITYALVVLVILVALYFVLPELTGLEDSLRKIEDADPVWIAVALGFNLLSFAAYIALFRGILGGRSVSPQRARTDRLAHLVPDHARGTGGDAAVLGRRRRRDRAHLLGAAPRRDGGAAGGEPDGRVPRAALHGVPAGARDLRDLPAGRPVPRPEPGRR